MEFDHERLHVYQRAMEALDLSYTIARGVPRGRAYLRDQLERAATSVVLNVAEGAGEFTPREKARFYRIAKRSATEVAAILDITGRHQMADRTLVARNRELLLRVVAMLIRLMRSEASTASAD